MENKYYTPELSEFYVGFEFEVLNNESKFYIPGLAKNEWSSIESNFGIFTSVEKIQRLILDKQIRVKNLDREDIESLGWEHDSTIKSESYFIHKDFSLITREEWRLIYDSKNNSIDISDLNNINLSFSFYGTIKNKSELKKIMQMLNIE